MSKKEKKPLSKAVGEWDNGYINTPKIDYTLDQLERAFRVYPKYKNSLNIYICQVGISAILLR